MNMTKKGEWAFQNLWWRREGY